MKTIIVDDEELAIRQFEMECKKLPWVNIVGRFHHAQEALEYVEKEKIEAAFLDIELPGMNGILLGRKLRELHANYIRYVRHVRRAIQVIHIAGDECG